MRLGDSIECSKWKTKLNAAYNKAITAIQKIKDNDGNEYIPDGNGVVTIDYSPTTVNGYDERITNNGQRIQREQTARANADANLQTQITANATSIATNATAIADETTARTTKDAELESAIDGKQDSLTSGTHIYLGAEGTIDATAVLTGITRTSDRVYAVGYVKNGTTAINPNYPIFTAGDNLSYNAGTGKLDATDTKYTAGSGINISDDNVISAQSSAPTAEQVLMSDGTTTVQSAIETANSSIATNTSNIATNTSNIATNSSSITALQTSVASKQDALTAGTGINISDNTIASIDCTDTITGGTGGSSSTTESEKKQLELSYSRRQYLFGNVLTGSNNANLFKLGTGLKFNDPDTFTTNPTIDVDTTAIQALLTAGTGIDITDNTISNSGVRTVEQTGITSSGTANNTSQVTGNRYAGIQVNTNGTTANVPLLNGYHQVTKQTTGSNSVTNTYSSAAVLNGGLKIQWGECYAYVNSTSYHKAVVRFRYSYSDADTYVVIPVVHDYDANDLWSYQVMVEDKTTTSFELHVSNGNTGTDISKDCKIMWLAIGY